MDGERTANRKSSTALLAFVRLFTGVRSHMSDQRTLSGAPLVTDIAFKWLLASVDTLVSTEIAGLREFSTTTRL